MIGRFLYRFFFNTDMSMGRYIIRSGVVSFVPSILVGAILVGSGLLTDESAPQLAGEGPVETFVTIVLVAPVLETILMAAILGLLSPITRRPLHLAGYSAIIWALLHSVVAPVWGLGVMWPFFVFSCGYLAWRRRRWWRGIWVASCIHAFQNFIPATLIVLESL